MSNTDEASSSGHDADLGSQNATPKLSDFMSFSRQQLAGQTQAQADDTAMKKADPEPATSESADTDSIASALSEEEAEVDVFSAEEGSPSIDSPVLKRGQHEADAKSEESEELEEHPHTAEHVEAEDIPTGPWAYPGASPKPCLSLDGAAGPSSLDLGRLSISSPASSSMDRWHLHKRHVFILNSAGKPIYSRYGDEMALAHFMAVTQAIISVVTDQGDEIKTLSVGRHQFVFVCKVNMYFVGVSSAGEPAAAIAKQLELLYNQVIFIVTTGVERVLVRNPAYDVRQLLAGTSSVFTALVKRFGVDVAYLLNATELLPMPSADRRMAVSALQEALKSSGALFGLITVGHRCVALERQPGSKLAPLSPLDVLLLCNFITCNDAFRFRYPESFSPVCMPHFNPSALLHCYIRYLEPTSGVCLLLLSFSADTFYPLSEARAALETALRDAGVLQRLNDNVSQPGGGRVRVDSLAKPAGGAVATTPLMHFLMKFNGRRQFLSSALPSELFPTRRSRKALVRAYVRLHCAVTAPQQRAGKPHRIHVVTTDRWVMAAYLDRECEMYIAFDPLCDKELAGRVCDQLRRHFLDKTRQTELWL